MKDQLTRDERIRLEALAQANHGAWSGFDTDVIISRADKFERYIREGADFEWKSISFSDASNVEELLGLVVGAASMCWEDVEKAGVFQDAKARLIVEAALERSRELYRLQYEIDNQDKSCD